MMLADCEVPELDGFVVAAGHDVQVVELKTGDTVGMRSGKNFGSNLRLHFDKFFML